MAGLLDGNLAASIYAGFRGKLLGGVIRRAVTAAGAEEDEQGDPAAPPAYQTHKIEGFSENYSRFTQSQAGIPATDLKLNIFAASAPGWEPRKDDQVRLDRRRHDGRLASTWYQIRGPVASDPAGVLWECQSFVIPAPPA